MVLGCIHDIFISYMIFCKWVESPLSPLCNLMVKGQLNFNLLNCVLVVLTIVNNSEGIGLCTDTHMGFGFMGCICFLFVY